MAKKKSHQEFIDEVKEKYGDEFSVLSEYDCLEKNITIKHNICGHERVIGAKGFFQNGGCPKCGRKIAGDKFRKSQEQFEKEVYNLVGNEYKIIGKYINTNTHITILHTSCNTLYSVTPCQFLSGSRCPNCFGNFVKSTKKFKNEVYNLVNKEYEVMGEYINSKSNILMKHLDCGHIYPVTPDNFLRGKRCPQCNMSKGEKKINDILKSYKIVFETQYTLKDCKNKKALPFDFAVFDYFNRLVFLIEFDGEHHYKPARYSKNKTKMLKKFEQVQNNDKNKENYCLKHNIPLLRIPYWEIDNIEEIINNFTEELSKRDNSFLILSG